VAHAAEHDEDMEEPVAAELGEAPAEIAGIEPGDAVGALMSTPVACVEPNVSLIELATTLEAEAVGAVPVMSGDHLDGVVSERDIVRALSAGGEPTDVWAGDVMADEPVYVDPDEPIITVAERMLDEGVRHVPVVSDGHVVGVVSVRDALRVLADAWRRTRTIEGERRGT
jgi:CBS domain-containing protein